VSLQPRASRVEPASIRGTGVLVGLGVCVGVRVGLDVGVGLGVDVGSAMGPSAQADIEKQATMKQASDRCQFLSIANVAVCESLLECRVGSVASLAPQRERTSRSIAHVVPERSWEHLRGTPSLRGATGPWPRGPLDPLSRNFAGKAPSNFPHARRVGRGAYVPDVLSGIPLYFESCSQWLAGSDTQEVRYCCFPSCYALHHEMKAAKSSATPTIKQQAKYGLGV
jgi:hypothetical protein